MKKFLFDPNVPAEIRAIPQSAALKILQSLHTYAATGYGKVKPLAGKFEGYFRLRVGTYSVIFEETADSITVHRVCSRKEAYR